MLELADIICRHGSAFLRSNPAYARRSEVVRAFQDIEHCRTAAFGGHLYQCSEESCGRQVYAYHSCRNRHCPKCHADQTKAWLHERQTELLPTPYFHLVFTVPGQLHAIIAANQRILYSILMREAAAALQKLAHDPKFSGGDIAVLAVLHTWTRALLYHPHVHCLVPAGALTPDQDWRPSNPAFLVPIHALSDIFRAKVRDAVKKAGLYEHIDPKAWQKRWVVYSKPAAKISDQVLNYLARYVHRVAITNSRIVDIGEQHITLRGCDRLNPGKLLKLHPTEFLRRFCCHILPQGFSKVRYYGLWSAPNRKKLKQLQLLLTPSTSNQPPEAPDLDVPTESLCPFCRKGHLIPVMTLPRAPQATFPHPLHAQPRGPP